MRTVSEVLVALHEAPAWPFGNIKGNLLNQTNKPDPPSLNLELQLFIIKVTVLYGKS